MKQNLAKRFMKNHFQKQQQQQPREREKTATNKQKESIRS